MLTAPCGATPFFQNPFSELVAKKASSYNTHGHKLHFPLSKKAQFVTECGIAADAHAGDVSFGRHGVHNPPAGDGDAESETWMSRISFHAKEVAWALDSAVGAESVAGAGRGVCSWVGIYVGVDNVGGCKLPIAKQSK